MEERFIKLGRVGTPKAMTLCGHLAETSWLEEFALSKPHLAYCRQAQHDHRFSIHHEATGEHCIDHPSSFHIADAILLSVRSLPYYIATWCGNPGYVEAVYSIYSIYLKTIHYMKQMYCIEGCV